MRTSSLIFSIIGLLLTVSLTSIWFYPSINDFMSGNKAWNGIRNFTDNFGVQNTDSLDNINEQSGQGVLVCIPYSTYTPDELSEIKEFANNGNLLLLLDDFGFGNSIMEYLGLEARFSNNILLDPLFNYKNQYFPRITDFASGIKESGIEAITLNHACTLKNIESSHILALSSSSSFEDINSNGIWDEGEPKGPLVVAANYKYGQGTVILISDPSITINTMVGENDNYEFINYLMTINNDVDNIILDRSHITKTPLDASKTNLENIKTIIADRYILLGLTAFIFVSITAFTFRKEELFN